MQKGVIFLVEILVIIACVIIADFTAIFLNRSILRNSDMMANTHMFNIRSTGFTIFFSIIMCSSLIAFAYFSFIGLGFNSRVIITTIILIIELLQLVKALFLKIEINNNAIKFRNLTRRGNLTFEDISKIEIASAFGFVIVDVFSNDGKVFVLNNMMLGYRMFIERLKKEGNVEWVNIFGNALDEFDM